MSTNCRYVKLATKFWTDEKIINLSHDAKLLNLYILTSPHANMAGYYRLPKAYMQADLQMSKEQLDKAFNKLLEIGLIKYCDDSSIVLLPNYFKYNSIQNKNQAKGAATRTKELPKNSLVEDYIKAIEEHAAKYKDVLFKGLPKGLDKGFDKHWGNTETVTETEYSNNNKRSDSDEPTNDSSVVDNSEEEKSEDDKPKFDEDSMPYKAAKYLRNLILENNKRQPVPDENPKDLEEWAVELDRLNRIGPIGANDKGYSWPEIGKIMEWCQDHHFWKSNILSASKFREQITKLENQMRNEKPKQNKQRDKDELLKKIYQRHKSEEEDQERSVQVL